MLVNPENVRGQLVDEPVVIDDRLITSRGPLDLPNLIEATGQRPD